jgi:hypothetical protein
VIRRAYWKARFSRWPASGPLRAGYTLLMPVPGDLPVFLDLSLAVCRLQQPSSRLRTLVIPDRWTPEIVESFGRARSSWPGDLVLLRLPLVDRVVLPRLGDGSRNHAAQLIAGVARSRSSHVILHDADLFLLRPEIHEDQYRYAVRHDLTVLGVDGAWDPWYSDHGRTLSDYGRTLAATWEMTARTDWLRSYPPHRHMAHVDELWGERHTFDTTFWAQCHTDQAVVAVRPPDDGIVHFNYVIGTYRKFLRRPQGVPFPDPCFLLLLIRVLVDLFDEGGLAYGLPSLRALSASLGRSDEAVAYPGAEAWQEYAVFRHKTQAILDGPWTSPSRRDAAKAYLAAFDGFYGWAPGDRAGGAAVRST